MRVVRLANIAAFAALCFCTPAQAQVPIKDGDILTGTLRVVNTRHDNGTKIVAYQIVSKPRAIADDGFCTAENGATTFHLFAITDAARKQLCYGKPPAAPTALSSTCERCPLWEGPPLSPL